MAPQSRTRRRRARHLPPLLRKTDPGGVLERLQGMGVDAEVITKQFHCANCDKAWVAGEMAYRIWLRRRGQVHPSRSIHSSRNACGSGAARVARGRRKQVTARMAGRLKHSVRWYGMTRLTSLVRTPSDTWYGPKGPRTAVPPISGWYGSSPYHLVQPVPPAVAG